MTGAQQALCAALALAALVSEAAGAELTLERVVLVSRHGVRAPTDSKKLDDYTRTPLRPKWLKWPVYDACLTPRGKVLASLMGAYYREEFIARGLFPADRSLASSQVHVLADVDQRTKQTGLGLLEGIFGPQPETGEFCPKPAPKSKLKPKQGDEENDWLFHPTRGKDKACALDQETAKQAILKRVDGKIETALKPYRGTVRQLQAVLDCCEPPACKQAGGGESCTLETLPSGIEKTPDGVGLSGPIAIGSTASEVFLLEYAQGMWGRASSPDQINALLKLHGLQFDLIQRTPYLAKRQGSALVRQVLETLRQTAEGQSDPIRPVPPEAKLVIYVGHDTNLANIGGTLGVDWEFKSGLQDKTPPAGAMAFELLREAGTSNYFVRMAYYTQTLDQMRDATPLRPSDPTGKTTPDVAKIVPGCASGGDGTCSWTDFHTWAKGALDPDCVAVKPR